MTVTRTALHLQRNCTLAQNLLHTHTETHTPAPRVSAPGPDNIRRALHDSVWYPAPSQSTIYSLGCTTTTFATAATTATAELVLLLPCHLQISSCKTARIQLLYI